METFGEALRRLREVAGLSQPALARRVHVSQASLSRYENGRQTVDPKTADRFDKILKADGALRSLLPTEPGPGITPDDRSRLAFVAERPRAVDRPTLDALAVVLAQSRRMEDTAGASAVLEPTLAYVRLLERLTLDACGVIRPAVVDLAAQFAQFTGWLHIAVGHPTAAGGWLDRALEWATETGNATLQANALTFKANLAWMAGHAASMIGLSQAAQRDTRIFVGQRAFAATQEARGLGAVGEVAACERKLAEAAELTEQLASTLDEPPPWNYDTPALLTLERGLVHGHLGRDQTAADLLAAGLDGLPPEQRQAEWTQSYRAEMQAVRAAL
jgi:transcriptional regulator with XRE-family HTH domain